MNTSNTLFNQTARDGAILSLALRMIPAALVLAVLFS